jgi:hypothetical protein
MSPRPRAFDGYAFDDDAFDCDFFQPLTFPPDRWTARATPGVTWIPVTASAEDWTASDDDDGL